jgi:hypothetical protein
VICITAQVKEPWLKMAQRGMVPAPPKGLTLLEIARKQRARLDLSLLMDQQGSGTMQVQEQLVARELTEAELDAVEGGFLGRLLAPYKDEFEPAPPPGCPIPYPN